MQRLLWIGLIVIFGLLGWHSAPVQADPIDLGFSLLQEANCASCHAIPSIAAPPRADSCTDCHAWIHQVAASPNARAKAMEIFPFWLRYEQNVKSYAAVPDLGAAMARLDPAWVAKYLSDPYDLRPEMPETMVRLGLNTSQINSIAQWFGKHQVAVPASPAPDIKNIPVGQKLFAERACQTCHSFGATLAQPGLPAAPDLCHARDRMGDDMLVAWLLSPQNITPAATMPTLGLSQSEAIALRDYLVLADPGGTLAPKAPALPPPPSEPVHWETVETKVFAKICVHCHMDPSQNDGRAGPGNAGGFGWPATGIQLQTRESVAAHAPAILAAMLRRREEQSRDLVGPGQFPRELQRPAMPGMPLGLPPIPDADIALVQAWMAQGCPE